MRAPLVAHFGDRVVVNPSLRELGFQSQLDAHQVWQELSVYLGNTLVDLATPPPNRHEEGGEFDGDDGDADAALKLCDSAGNAALSTLPNIG